MKSVPYINMKEGGKVNEQINTNINTNNSQIDTFTQISTQIDNGIDTQGIITRVFEHHRFKRAILKSMMLRNFDELWV